MSTAASTPTAQTGTHRNPDVAATARPGPGLWTRSLALSRWILREHALARLLCLGGGTAFVSLCLLLERTGLFSSFLTWAGVAEADQDGISTFRYTSTALVMTLFQNIILGALTATRTTHLLVSGTTRATLGAAHLQVAVLLGCELTGLMVPLTLADRRSGPRRPDVPWCGPGGLPVGVPALPRRCVGRTELIVGSMLLDPATGTLSEAPWVPQAYSAAAVTSELALACRTSATTGDPVTCSAWDWNNGSPERRWRRAYDVDSMFLDRALGMSGSADDGSVVVETQPAGTGTSEPGDTESTDEPGTSRAVRLMSLADGSLHGSPSAERVSSDTGAGPSYIPARDGWVRVAESGTEATVVSSGSEDGQVFPVQDIPTVLLVDGNAPTVSQLRAAYETGDTSWADTVLRCEDASTCTLNGSPADIPEESLSEQRLRKGGYQAQATLSTDGRTPEVPSSPFRAKRILLIDTESGQVSAPAQETAQREAQRVVYTARATEDLVLLVLGTQVVAYSPTG